MTQEKKSNKKWINSTIYPCRDIGKYPQIYTERVMHGKYRGVSINLYEGYKEIGTVISMTNRMTRLLIKRLQMALNGD